MLSEPAGKLTGREDGTVDAGAGGDVGLVARQRLEQAVAQHPELQAVEHLVHLVAVPGLHAPGRRVQRQLEVAHQRVELTVAQHVAEVLAQRLALLAGDLLGVRDHAFEAVVLVEPLRREALAHAGHAGEVVGGLAHDGRELGITLGGTP